MKKLIESLTSGRGNLPTFTSCTSFEYPDSEYILYTGDPRMIFEVVDEIPTSEQTPRFFRFIEHNNGDQDYIVVADCFDEQWFAGKSVDEATEHIEAVMDALEGWYVSEVIDLDSYE
ncbi:MAG: hypothetical protein RR465_05885 [Mucinivorans sp.]